jgi:hypothetical protein
MPLFIETLSDESALRGMRKEERNVEEAKETESVFLAKCTAL